MTARITTLLPALLASLTLAPARGADPVFYVRKDTPQATILASRGALAKVDAARIRQAGQPDSRERHRFRPQTAPPVTTKQNGRRVSVDVRGRKLLWRIHEIGDDQSIGARGDARLTAADKKKVPLSSLKHVSAKGYDDYRKLLEQEKSLDAVMIVTGSRWHVPLSVTFIKAGKHVYCEKPPAYRIAEARELVEVAGKCKVATQTGTRGASSKASRRAVEVIRTGVPGQVRQTCFWCDGYGANPPRHVTAGLKAARGKVPKLGCLFVGDRGELCAGGWGEGVIMRMKGEKGWRGVLDHEAAKAVAVTLPRAPRDNHVLEWLQACRGGPPTFTGLDVGGHAAEVYLPGIVSLRLGRAIKWDGSGMKAPDAPGADPLIRKDRREKWLI